MCEAHTVEKEQEVADDDAWPPAIIHDCGRETKCTECAPADNLTCLIWCVSCLHGIDSSLPIRPTGDVSDERCIHLMSEVDYRGQEGRDAPGAGCQIDRDAEEGREDAGIAAAGCQRGRLGGRSGTMHRKLRTPVSESRPGAPRYVGQNPRVGEHDR